MDKLKEVALESPRKKSGSGNMMSSFAKNISKVARIYEHGKPVLQEDLDEELADKEEKERDEKLKKARDKKKQQAKVIIAGAHNLSKGSSQRLI